MMMSPNEDVQLSMAATSRVIWLYACVRYWPYREVGMCASVLKMVLFPLSASQVLKILHVPSVWVQFNSFFFCSIFWPFFLHPSGGSLSCISDKKGSKYSRVPLYGYPLNTDTSYYEHFFCHWRKPLHLLMRTADISFLTN